VAVPITQTVLVLVQHLITAIHLMEVLLALAELVALVALNRVQHQQLAEPDTVAVAEAEAVEQAPVALWEMLALEAMD